MASSEQPHKFVANFLVFSFLLVIVGIWLFSGCMNYASSLAYEHFRTVFANPKLLIEGMANHNFGLIGSRALDYFVHGSASPTSNWNFLITNDDRCIAGAMHVLEKCGVVWDDAVKPLRKLFDSNEAQAIHLTRESAQVFTELWLFTKHKTLSSNPDFERLMKDLYNAVCALNLKGQTHRDRIHRVIKIKNAMIHVQPMTNQTDTHDGPFQPYGPSFNVFRGTITSSTTGTVQAVELIASLHDASNTNSDLDLIFASYASHTQCFVSAYGAAHLYFPADKKAIVWPANVQRDPFGAQAAREKFMARGYEFTGTAEAGHGDSVVRRLADPEGPGKLVEFRFPFAFRGVAESVQTRRREQLRGFEWLETAEGTCVLNDAVPDEVVEVVIDKSVEGRDRSELRRWRRARRAVGAEGAVVMVDCKDYGRKTEREQS